MKKLSAYTLLIVITYILISISFSCKSRKLSRSSETIEDKTKSEQTSNVKQESQSTAERKETNESQISDRSGTWIWEEWYQKDMDADTLISRLPGLIYKRTTFVKNDITKVEKQEVSDFKNHSEIKDSVGSQAIQKDIRNTIETKELDAVKQSSTGWIWALTGLAFVLVALAFIIRKL